MADHLRRESCLTQHSSTRVGREPQAICRTPRQKGKLLKTRGKPIPLGPEALMSRAETIKADYSVKTRRGILSSCLLLADSKTVHEA